MPFNTLTSWLAVLIMVRFRPQAAAAPEVGQFTLGKKELPLQLHNLPAWSRWALLYLPCQNTWGRHWLKIKIKGKDEVKRETQGGRHEERQTTGSGRICTGILRIRSLKWWMRMLECPCEHAHTRDIRVMITCIFNPTFHEKREIDGNLKQKRKPNLNSSVSHIFPHLPFRLIF